MRRKRGPNKSGRGYGKWGMPQEGPASLQTLDGALPSVVVGERNLPSALEKEGGCMEGAGEEGGVQTSPAMSNRSEARAKWQTGEMQRLRGEGCAAVLTEDDVVMAVSEGVTRDRLRERKAHV